MGRFLNKNPPIYSRAQGRDKSLQSTFRTAARHRVPFSKDIHFRGEGKRVVVNHIHAPKALKGHRNNLILSLLCTAVFVFTGAWQCTSGVIALLK